jgi:hypothetical protein
METTPDLVLSSAPGVDIRVDAVSDAGRNFFARRIGPAVVGVTVPIRGLQQLVTEASAEGLVCRAA